MVPLIGAGSRSGRSLCAEECSGVDMGKEGKAYLVESQSSPCLGRGESGVSAVCSGGRAGCCPQFSFSAQSGSSGSAAMLVT